MKIHEQYCEMLPYIKWELLLKRSPSLRVLKKCPKIIYVKLSIGFLKTFSLGNALSKTE